MHAGEHAEALGDFQRAVMGEHHPAAADAHLFSRFRDRTDENLRARAGKHRRRMMLGHPIATKAEPVGEPCEVKRVAQRIAPA
jgi:hypothetical protein